MSVKVLGKSFNILIVALLLLCLAGCKKESKKEEKPEPTEPPKVSGSDPRKADNVFTLSSSAVVNSDVSSGKITISDNNLLKAINKGNILLKEGEAGFLVEVVEKNGSVLDVKESSLDKLFKSGKFAFSSSSSTKTTQSINDTSGYKTNALNDDAYSYTMNTTIPIDDEIEVGLSGTASINPNLSGSIDFSLSGNHKVAIKMENAPININGQLSITASPKGIMNVTKEVSLGEISKSTIIYGVYTTIKIKIIDRINISGTADINETITFDSDNVLNANLDYDEKWSSAYDFKNVKNTVKLEQKAKATVKIKHEIIPSLSVEFFKVAGLYVRPIIYNTFKYGVNVIPTSGLFFWHHTVDKGFNFEIGATQRLLSKSDYPLKQLKIIPSTIIYEAPKKIEITDGNNQTANAGATLPKTFKVKALDSENNPLAKVMVLFSIKEGDGVIIGKNALTNSSGIAEAKYVVGSKTTQIVAATLKDEKEQNLSVVNFNVKSTQEVTLIELVSGDKQVALAKQKLDNPLVVKITDQVGKEMKDIEVTWLVTQGGGTISAAKTMTNALGLAQVNWTLGLTGTQQVTASAKRKDGTLLNGAPIKFAATASIPTTIQMVGTNNQEGKANQALSKPLVVKVTDKNNKAVKGIDVAWSIVAGDGKLSVYNTVTDAQGLVQVIYTPGKAEKHEITATAKDAEGLRLNGAPIKFAAYLPVPYYIQYLSGNSQTGSANKVLAKPLQVKITNKDGKIMNNVEVNWAVTQGNGTVSATKNTTNTEGVAWINWTLGSADKHEVSATARKPDGTLLSGAPIKFTASTVDSLELYKAAVVGNWLVTTYDNGVASPLTSEYIVKANGTGQHNYYINDKGVRVKVPDGDRFNTTICTVTKTSEGYIFSMKYNNRNLTYSGRLVKYPNMEYKAYPLIGNTKSWAIVKKLKN